MRSLPILIGLLSTSLPVLGSGTWISLNMTASPSMTDADQYLYSQAPVMLGTPPQEVDMTVNLYSTLLASMAYDCNLCAGGTFFDGSLSSTLASSNRSWAGSSSQLAGKYFKDTVGFGSDLQLENTDFVLISDMNTKVRPHIQNGNIGLFVNNQNSSTISQSYISQLWSNGKLLNPVIGMRFNPENPKLTIGALDPADYEGEINWVQMETPDPSWDLPNVFKMDGFKGYDGSLLNIGSSDGSAGLNSLFNNIAVPNNWPYLADTTKRGPGNVWLDPTRPDFAYACNASNGTVPYASLTAVINGVDYLIDSADNLVHTPGMSAGLCNIGFQNNSVGTSEPPSNPAITLGLTFLRSVYVAYRFPTDTCPGYYGFAFPSGANRTDTQKAQKPTSTPSSSSQCLQLTAPTSTPTLSRSPGSPQSNARLSQAAYTVYGESNEQQVQLVGVDDLPRGVWNQSNTP